MQDYFNSVADVLTTMLQGDEVFTCNFSGEESDFVRFNNNEIRQAGQVTQRSVGVDLIAGKKHACGDITLAGNLEIDRPRLAALVSDLREKNSVLPEDPHLFYSTDVNSTERVQENKVPDAASAIGDIQRAGKGRDVVGIYAGGGLHVGFANSLGQRNWQSTHSFNFDWSFYKEADKAVKNAYAGFDWRPEELKTKVATADEQLQALGHAPQTIKPGRYRVYLTPAALGELVSIVGYSCGLRAKKTKTTPLIRLVEGGGKLHDALTVQENTAGGISPNFEQNGFIKPDSVTLIENGQYANSLVSPRSSKEYGVPTNGASNWEHSQSVDVSAGTLPSDDVLNQLGTGVLISNLWYLNLSDRNACRTTGMTRFATFWVEGGKIQGPMNVMRFDETIYRALGENLVALTTERDFFLDPSTYFSRSTSSARLPGALVDDFTFTL